MTIINRLKSLAKAFMRRDVVYESWDERFHLYNFWKLNRNKVQDVWLYNFIDYHQLIPKNKRLNFVSVFGNREISRFVSKPKIFFTGENVHTKVVNSHFDRFDNNYLSKFDLSMGFDYEDKVGLDKYLRFPLWILYIIPFDADFDEIKSIISDFNNPNRCRGNRNKFAAHIARHDNNGIRKKIISTLEKIDHVDSAGAFMNNTNDLVEEFADDKLAYLKTFKFNICPENSDAEGYVTEKIFESIQTGCIPVYWGSGNNPEPDILNSEAIVFFDERKPQIALEKVQLLYSDSSAYEEFIKIPPFQEGAAEKIWSIIERFKKELSIIKFT